MQASPVTSVIGRMSREGLPSQPEGTVGYTKLSRGTVSSPVTVTVSF